MPSSNENVKQIYLGGGCFWCVEAIFEDVTGVLNVISGYAGGEIENPRYEQVCKGLTNHAEVCKITYDESQIQLNNLLEIFFLTHDPTTLNRQGNDIGKHYRSIILFKDPSERKIIENYIKFANKEWFNNKIVTEVKELISFNIAEDYHQGYYKQNAQQPYCSSVITPKILNARKKLAEYY